MKWFSPNFRDVNFVPRQIWARRPASWTSWAMLFRTAVGNSTPRSKFNESQYQITSKGLVVFSIRDPEDPQGVPILGLAMCRVSPFERKESDWMNWQWCSHCRLSQAAAAEHLHETHAAKEQVEHQTLISLYCYYRKYIITRSILLILSIDLCEAMWELHQSKEIPPRQETYGDPQAAVAEKAARVAAELRQKLERSSSEAPGDGSGVVHAFNKWTPRQFNEEILKTYPKRTESRANENRITKTTKRMICLHDFPLPCHAQGPAFWPQVQQLQLQHQQDMENARPAMASLELELLVECCRTVVQWFFGGVLYPRGKHISIQYYTYTCIHIVYIGTYIYIYIHDISVMSHRYLCITIPHKHLWYELIWINMHAHACEYNKSKFCRSWSFGQARSLWAAAGTPS